MKSLCKLVILCAMIALTLIGCAHTTTPPISTNSTPMPCTHVWVSSSPPQTVHYAHIIAAESYYVKDKYRTCQYTMLTDAQYAQAYPEFAAQHIYEVFLPTCQDEYLHCGICGAQKCVSTTICDINGHQYKYQKTDRQSSVMLDTYECEQCHCTYCVRHEHVWNPTDVEPGYASLYYSSRFTDNHRVSEEFKRSWGSHASDLYMSEKEYAERYPELAAHGIWYFVDGRSHQNYKCAHCTDTTFKAISCGPNNHNFVLINTKYGDDNGCGGENKEETYQCSECHTLLTKRYYTVGQPHDYELQVIENTLPGVDAVNYYYYDVCKNCGRKIESTAHLPNTTHDFILSNGKTLNAGVWDYRDVPIYESAIVDFNDEAQIMTVYWSVNGQVCHKIVQIDEIAQTTAYSQVRLKINADGTLEITGII